MLIIVINSHYVENSKSVIMMKFRFSIDVKSVLKTNKDKKSHLKFNSTITALSPILI
jgi:hypothetical protein